MALLQEELRNFSYKGWQGILGTGNRSTAPDNLTYYEEQTTNSVSIHPRSVLLEIDLIPPARNQTDAHNNAITNPTLIQEFATTNAIHLTPSPNQKAFFATATYGDLTSRLYNFIMPQFTPRVDAGSVGMPSIGYTIRLYQGDPNAGGVEIPTTIDQIGGDVGWFTMYGAGAIVVASSFSGISDPTDLWITGYQYIGKTAGDTVTSNTIDKVYRYAFLGSDTGDTAPYKDKGFSTGRFMVRDKTKYKVFQNGTELSVTDWDFLDPVDMRNPAPQGLPEYQATIIINAAYLPADEFIVEYTETIDPQTDFQIKLFRSDGQALRPYMIPKSVRIDDTPMYNETTNIINPYTVDVTYRDMYSATTSTKQKRFPDSFRLSEFPTGFDMSILNLVIEVYKTEKSWNTAGDNVSGGTRTQSVGKNTRLVYTSSINSINFDSFVGTKSGQKNVGIYKVRLRNTVTNVFSGFLTTSISLREFPVCQTNSSVSVSDCVGYYKSARLI